MYYSTRDEMVTGVINENKLRLGIEVGVREGSFSRHMLVTTNIACLYGVDIGPIYSAKRLEVLFPGRYRMYLGRSPEFASKFSDGFFDFIHIDACHTYEAVKADLEAWWPKLRVGGFFTGDDYCLVKNPVEGDYGVVEAVNEFMSRHSLEFYVTGIKATDEKSKLAWAASNGEQASKFLAQQPYEPFVTPAWYCVKP